MKVITRAGMVFPLLAVACTPSINDPPASTQMAPAEQPKHAVGTIYHEWDLIDAKASAWRVVAVDGGTFTGETDTGCRFTNSDPVLPVLSWKNCGSDPAWRDGTRTYTALEGSLWPLRVGSRASYQMTWTGNGGETDRGTLDCTVDGTAHITVRAGEFDTYRVVCVQRWEGVTRDRITYWAPDVGAVKYSSTHSKRGTTESWELVSIDRA